MRAISKLMMGISLGAMLAVATAGSGAVVWNFNPSNLNQAGGTTLTVASSPVSGVNLTAAGYSSAGTPINLYLKSLGGDEVGLGINGTLDNEITLKSNGTPANFIQVNLTPALGGFSNFQIMVGSVQNNSASDTEKYDVWASSTPGTLGTRILTGITPTNDGVFVNIPGVSSSAPYISVTVTDLTANTHGNTVDNVLLEAIEAVPAVPEPEALVIWSILGTLAIGMSWWGWRKRA